jgi:hypothetical protein
MAILAEEASVDIPNVEFAARLMPAKSGAKNPYRQSATPGTVQPPRNQLFTTPAMED